MKSKELSEDQLLDLLEGNPSMMKKLRENPRAQAIFFKDMEK
jgi:hypothetical protein